MNVLSLEQELQAMLGQGEMLAAFEKYYAEEIVMVEATGDVRKGKDVNRKFEQEWLNGIKETHGGGVGAITANELTRQTCSETWVDVTFQDGSRKKLEEVSVKQWKDGLVIHERFYYNMA